MRTATLILAADTTVDGAPQDGPEYLGCEVSVGLVSGLLAAMDDAGGGVLTLAGSELWVLDPDVTERRYPALRADAARALVTAGGAQVPLFPAVWVVDRAHAFLRAPGGAESLVLSRDLLTRLLAALPDWDFPWEGQCFLCGGYSEWTNRHNVCVPCARDRGASGSGHPALAERDAATSWP